MTATVTVYGRPGCCLCDEARERLEGLRASHAFALEEIDITADDALHARYLERIPVVALDGREIYDCDLDVSELPRLLDEASSRELRRIE